MAFNCMFIRVSVLAASAQQNQTENGDQYANCDGCKERIETFLGRMYGVTSVKGDVKKRR